MSRTSGKQIVAKRISKRKHIISRFRGQRSKRLERVHRVYSQRWETKLAQHAVAYKPYTTTQEVSGESTAIYSMSYDPKRQILWLTFWRYKQRGAGHTYAYYKVDPSVWEQLNEASSKGRYFWYYIRGQYNFARIR